MADLFETENVEGVEYVVLDDVRVNPEIFRWDHRCDFRHCNLSCCDEGCWITLLEKWRVHGDLLFVRPYLEDVPGHPFNEDLREYWESDPEDDLWHTQVFDGRCIFQHPDGRCAIHAYCLDAGLDWKAYKFNICVTFPLDLTFEEGVHFVDFLKDHDLFMEKLECLRRAGPTPPADGWAPVVDACREVLVDRLGERRYRAVRTAHARFTRAFFPARAC